MRTTSNDSEISLIGAIIEFYVISNIYFSIDSFITRNVNLHKASKYDGYTIVNPEQIKDYQNTAQILEPTDFTKKERIKPYLEELKKHVNEEDLKTAYKNIATLRIRKIYFMPFPISGAYDSKRNKLIFKKKKIIGHEFLHMASSVYDKTKKIILSGFCQRRKGAVIGVGLNEGYTELLNRRLFTELNGKRTLAYQTLVEVTELIEMFYEDKKKMSHHYFTNNLPAVIEELSKYMPKEEAINTIVEMDKILIAYESSFGTADLKKALNLKYKLLDIYKQTHPNELEKITLFEEKVSQDMILQFKALFKEIKETFKEAKEKALIKSKNNEHNLS